jgi:hypothetical protein
MNDLWQFDPDRTVRRDESVAPPAKVTFKEVTFTMATRRERLRAWFVRHFASYAK